MGKMDVATKDYISDNDVFADAFNYLLYGGRAVIDSRRLKEMDTELLGMPHGKNGKSVPIQRYRDKMKYLTMKEDENAAYILLGIEAQTDVHYAMPVRNMVYDALQYAKQIDIIASAHRQSRSNKHQGQKKALQIKEVSRGEYLSGIYKTDRLVPIITLVIFFNSEHWVGPVRLHDMFPAENADILRYIPDYPINMISPADMSEDEINLLSSSLREVILFIKNASDEERIRLLMMRNERFRKLDMKAVRFLNQLLNCDLQFDEEREELDMCKALDDMRMHARMEGVLSSITSLMESMGWTVEEAMNALRIPDEERMEYQAKLQM